ncbi:MAG TPA: RluA family pseudouridine synthase [Bacillales bacterium]|nr:RluA family pseudouridine synthase [Bacillales bacterium]
MEKITLAVEEKDGGKRLDKWLASASERSRTQVQQWIREGLVRVDGRRVKANHKIECGNTVVMDIPETEPLRVEPENIPLDVAYEDPDVIVVNKPRGMVVHPAPGHASGTLVNALLYHCADLSGINGVVRPGIVHRIDKDTSGLLVAAKNDRAHDSLARQLKDKSVERLYRAIVHGVVRHNKGTVDAPIGRDPKDRKKMAVTEKNSKAAVTHFTVLERLGNFTYVECRLETGRTHQIRVHMKYIGHPLVGDPKYGPKKTLALKGQALHAAVLGFEHPRTGEYLRFEAPLPDDIEQLLRKLEEGTNHMGFGKN